MHHGREFRRRERAYVDYGRAIVWEKRNLMALIRAALAEHQVLFFRNQDLSAEEHLASSATGWTTHTGPYS